MLGIHAAPRPLAYASRHVDGLALCCVSGNHHLWPSPVTVKQRRRARLRRVQVHRDATPLLAVGSRGLDKVRRPRLPLVPMSAMRCRPKLHMRRRDRGSLLPSVVAVVRSMPLPGGSGCEQRPADGESPRDAAIARDGEDEPPHGEEERHDKQPLGQEPRRTARVVGGCGHAPEDARRQTQHLRRRLQCVLLHSCEARSHAAVTARSGARGVGSRGKGHRRQRYLAGAPRTDRHRA